MALLAADEPREIADLFKIAGPGVLIVAAVFAAINVSGAAPNERFEAVMNGALLGAVVGALLASAGFFAGV